MSKMVCFDPRDTVFLLNKWDTIIDPDDKEDYLQSTKRTLHTIWNEIDDRRILKLSAGRVKICICIKTFKFEKKNMNVDLILTAILIYNFKK